jgi:hypothetical protein
MQDNQIGPKIVGLAPADEARLPPSIIATKIFLVVNNLGSLSAEITPTLNLPCFTGKIVSFLLIHSPSRS